MRNYAYDSADKPSAPPPDAAAFAPPQPQPQREPSASFLYAQPVHDAQAHNQRSPMPPMPPLPPLAPQHSAYVPPRAHPAHAYPPYHGPHADADDMEEDESVFYVFTKETGRLALFHMLNSLLGYVAFTVCVGGLATSVALLPLCCFGIVVFRVLLYAVYGFAQLDVMLYNLITSAEDHVYVQVPQNPRTGSLSGERLAPTLAAFSPLSLMALIYFCTIKFLLSTLSTICFSLTVTAPLSLLCAVLGIRHGAIFQVQLGPEDVADFDSDPFLFLLATLCLFVIGVAFMHLVARASREATRFFCCERFSTYRYVHQHYDAARAQFYPAALPAYGTLHSEQPLVAAVLASNPVVVRF